MRISARNQIKVGGSVYVVIKASDVMIGGLIHRVKTHNALVAARIFSAPPVLGRLDHRRDKSVCAANTKLA